MRKKWLIILALCVALSSILSTSAFADTTSHTYPVKDSGSASLPSVSSITGSSEITFSSGSASTYASVQYCYKGVSGKYTAMKTYGDYEVQPQTKSNNSTTTNSTSVSFTAPSNYQSYMLEATHTVINNATSTFSTKVTYLKTR